MTRCLSRALNPPAQVTLQCTDLYIFTISCYEPLKGLAVKRYKFVKNDRPTVMVISARRMLLLCIQLNTSNYEDQNMKKKNEYPHTDEYVFGFRSPRSRFHHLVSYNDLLWLFSPLWRKKKVISRCVCLKFTAISSRLYDLWHYLNKKDLIINLSVHS